MEYLTFLIIQDNQILNTKIFFIEQFLQQLYDYFSESKT